MAFNNSIVDILCCLMAITTNLPSGLIAGPPVIVVAPGLVRFIAIIIRIMVDNSIMAGNVCRGNWLRDVFDLVITRVTFSAGCVRRIWQLLMLGTIAIVGNYFTCDCGAGYFKCYVITTIRVPTFPGSWINCSTLSVICFVPSDDFHF